LLVRNRHPEIARGRIDMVEPLCSEDYAAIIKTYDDNSIGIIYNISSYEEEINVKGTELENMEICDFLTLNNEKIRMVDGVIAMPANSICVLD